MIVGEQRQLVSQQTAQQGSHSSQRQKCTKISEVSDRGEIVTLPDSTACENSSSIKCDAITRNLKWIMQNKSSKESARIAKWGKRLPTCFQHILEGSFSGSFLPTFFGQPLVYVQSASKHGFSRTSPHWPAQISRVDWNSVRFFCLMSRVLKHLCCCMSVARKNDPPQIDHGVLAYQLLLY